MAGRGLLCLAALVSFIFVFRQTYLQKYGYLQCSTARRRRRYISDGVIVREGGRNEERGRRICRESDVREAVRVLQSTLRLRPTGIIDNETRHAMSSRRCGNNDVAVSVAAAAVADRDHRGPMRPPGQRTRSRVIRNVVDDLDHRRHRPRHRRRRNNRRVDEARVGSHGVEVGSRINLTALPPAPAIAIRGLVLEKIPSSNDEWRRRAEMLRQIKTRVTAELNRPTTARERSLARAVSRLATARRVRKRRSLRAVSIDQVFEGPAGRSTRFPKDRPVRWRLLDDRYSAKIPLAEQKSRLELSFRMWSEVTPIKFVEDRQTSILDIDILIAFGKRKSMLLNICILYQIQIFFSNVVDFPQHFYYRPVICSFFDHAFMTDNSKKTAERLRYNSLLLLSTCSYWTISWSKWMAKKSAVWSLSYTVAEILGLENST